jgi:hypothetical protein
MFHPVVLRNLFSYLSLRDIKNLLITCRSLAVRIGSIHICDLRKDFPSFEQLSNAYKQTFGSTVFKESRPSLGNTVRFRVSDDYVFVKILTGFLYRDTEMFIFCVNTCLDLPSSDASNVSDEKHLVYQYPRFPLYIPSTVKQFEIAGVSCYLNSRISRVCVNNLRLLNSLRKLTICNLFDSRIQKLKLKIMGNVLDTDDITNVTSLKELILCTIEPETIIPSCVESLIIKDYFYDSLPKLPLALKSLELYYSTEFPPLPDGITCLRALVCSGEIREVPDSIRHIYLPCNSIAFKTIPRNIEILHLKCGKDILPYYLSDKLYNQPKPLIIGHNTNAMIIPKEIKRLCLMPQHLKLFFHDEFEELIISSDGELVFSSIPFNLRKLSIHCPMVKTEPPLNTLIPLLTKLEKLTLHYSLYHGSSGNPISRLVSLSSTVKSLTHLEKLTLYDPEYRSYFCICIHLSPQMLPKNLKKLDISSIRVRLSERLPEGIEKLKCEQIEHCYLPKG